MSLPPSIALPVAVLVPVPTGPDAENRPRGRLATRRVAVLVAPGFAEEDLTLLSAMFSREGALVDLVGPRFGPILGRSGAPVEVFGTFRADSGALYDAIAIPGGAACARALAADADARTWIRNRFGRTRAVAAIGAGRDVLRAAVPEVVDRPSPRLLVTGTADARFLGAFLAAVRPR